MINYIDFNLNMIFQIKIFKNWYQSKYLPQFDNNYSNIKGNQENFSCSTSSWGFLRLNKISRFRLGKF